MPYKKTRLSGTLFCFFYELYFIFRELFVYIHELIYAAIYIIYDTFIVKIKIQQYQIWHKVLK